MTWEGFNPPRMLLIALALVAAPPAAAAHSDEPRPKVDAAIDRAVSYLAGEVPAWRAENGCLSCHNNGDGARVLYLAERLGRRVDPAALEETSAWLRTPEEWKATGRQEAGDSGEKLALIQFGAALAEMLRSTGERVRDRDQARLVQAAQLVAGIQEADGAWRIGAKGSLGAPVTYGPFLATATALDVMTATGDAQFRQHIERGERWLRSAEPRSVLDASATLLGLADADDRETTEQKRRSLDLLREAQQDSGGWGPYATAPSEPFDTAIALIALATIENDASITDMINHGRRHLLSTQLDGGSWPETTRPAGAVSYAQHISTTSWALKALLITRSIDRRK